MFESWSEPRRRWFLVVFVATAWLGFVNALAMLGEHFGTGGIGGEALHLGKVVAFVGVGALLFGVTRLRMTDFVAAMAFGVAISAALVDFGIRDHAAAAMWSMGCESGTGAACEKLADFYADGKSPVHGWLDAVPLYARACEQAAATSRACAIARQFAPRPARVRAFDADASACVAGSASACRAAAAVLAGRGDAEGANRFTRAACELRDQKACMSLLDSGYTDLRLQACELLEPACRTSSSHECAIAVRRCERVRSPNAGTN